MSDITSLATTQYQNLSIKTPTAKASASADGKVDKNSPLYKQCEEFESLLVNMMLKEMRKSVDKSGSLIEESTTENVFSDMLYEEYSKSMSHNANFGLSDQLYTQLSRSGYQS